MTVVEFRKAVHELLAMPVDHLSTKEKAMFVRERIGKSSNFPKWSFGDLLLHLCPIGLSALGLIVVLDWWFLSILWILAASAYYLAELLPVASHHLTGAEFHSAVHEVLDQPVDYLSANDKVEVIQACLVDMERKEKSASWRDIAKSAAFFMVMFAGVATILVLFPGIQWWWCFILGEILGFLVVLLLLFQILRVVRWLVKRGRQKPSS
jgi:hypothetical protein